MKKPFFRYHPQFIVILKNMFIHIFRYIDLFNGLFFHMNFYFGFIEFYQNGSKSDIKFKNYMLEIALQTKNKIYNPEISIECY